MPVAGDEYVVVEDLNLGPLPAVVAQLEPHAHMVVSDELEQPFARVRLRH